MKTERSTTKISKPEKTDILVQGLTDVLHDTFTLYRATHLAHWNVRGRSFPQLHALFQTQYTELWEATDTLAERIRTYGVSVPAGVLGGDGVHAGEHAEATVRELAKRHRDLASRLRDLEQAASAAHDPATADLATERIRAHEQAAWMLEASVEG